MLFTLREAMLSQNPKYIQNRPVRASEAERLLYMPRLGLAAMFQDIGAALQRGIELRQLRNEL